MGSLQHKPAQRPPTVCCWHVLFWMFVSVQSIVALSPRSTTWGSRWWTAAWARGQAPSAPVRNAPSMSGKAGAHTHRHTWTRLLSHSQISCQTTCILKFYQPLGENKAQNHMYIDCMMHGIYGFTVFKVLGCFPLHKSDEHTFPLPSLYWCYFEAPYYIDSPLCNVWHLRDRQWSLLTCPVLWHFGPVA